MTKDPVERAFDLLRRQHVRLAPRDDLASTAHRHPSRGTRPWAVAAAITIVCGGVFAASGGVAWLAGWSYSVQVDNREFTGAVTGNGDRTLTVATEDGGHAVVRVRRSRFDGATHTRIDVERRSPERYDVERFENRPDDRGTRRESLPLTAIDGLAPIYRGARGDGRRYALYVVPEGWRDSRVLVHRHGVGAASLDQIARVPFRILRDGTEVEILERADGSLALSFDDGHGAEFEFVWSDTDAPQSPEIDWQTPDGTVRVRVKDTAQPTRR